MKRESIKSLRQLLAHSECSMCYWFLFVQKHEPTISRAGTKIEFSKFLAGARSTHWAINTVPGQ